MTIWARKNHLKYADLPRKLPASESWRIRSKWIEEQGWCIWLENDPRSVPAMLRGRGDGREKLYEKFVQYWRARSPRIPERALLAKYTQYANYMDSKVWQERRALQQVVDQTSDVDLVHVRKNGARLLIGRSLDGSSSHYRLLCTFHEWVVWAIVAAMLSILIMFG